MRRLKIVGKPLVYNLDSMNSFQIRKQILCILVKKQHFTLNKMIQVENKYKIKVIFKNLQ